MPTRQVFLLLGASWEVKRAEEIGGKFVDHFAPPNECLVSSRRVSSWAAQVEFRVWITAGVSLVPLTLWACRSRAALKYKRATVTSRRCCCKLFPVTPVWLQGFSGISVDYGAVTRVACRNLFIFYFNVFILKIIRPARGFLPLPFGVRWGYLCSLKFCFLWISWTIRKILYQDAHWFILN